MSDSNSTERRVGFAIALNLGAFLCFSVMDTGAKWLVTGALISLQVSWLRYVVHFLWVVALYLPGQGVQLARSNQPWQQAFRSVLLLLGTLFNFAALSYLPLTVTIAIFFTSPLVVCLLSIPFLGEKVGIKRLLAVAAGFVGVLVIVSPWDESFDWHVVLSLAAVCCVSGYFVMSRRMAGVDSNAVMQFYTAGIATALLTPAVFFVAPLPSGLDAISWMVGLLIGSLGMLGHSLLTRAHRHAEASVLAPTVYAQAIYVAFLSWLIFEQAPTQNTILGTFIIIASGLYLWLREKQLSKTTQ